MARTVAQNYKKAPEKQSLRGVIFILPQRVNQILPDGVNAACPRGTNARGFSKSLWIHFAVRPSGNRRRIRLMKG